MAKKRAKVMETRYFGLIIGLFIVALFFLINTGTAIFSNIELKILDVHFSLKNAIRGKSFQEGVTYTEKNLKVSDDILIVGIDFNTLSKYGKWPFPRYHHADLINSFSRIKDQTQREMALFLDIFFIEPDKKAADDALLLRSVQESGRVFFETVLDEAASDSTEEFWNRQNALYENWGSIKNVSGLWEEVVPFFGVQPPLKPFSESVRGYGHANYVKDADKIYRRQALVAKSSQLIETIKADELKPGFNLDRKSFERLCWIDKDGIFHPISLPLTEKSIKELQSSLEKNAPPKVEDTNQDGEPDLSYFVVRKYKDNFVPAITLSLAVEYFHKKLDDIVVVLGKEIVIPSPERFNPDTGEWAPYTIQVTPDVSDKDGNIIKEGTWRTVPEIRIPINSSGEMLINFMGEPSSAGSEGYQTFAVRSFAGYSEKAPGPDPSTWRKTMAVANKIIMAGPFAKGMAQDEKPTPYGLMYGVEIHANALNTILMDNFIHPAPPWLDAAILFVLVMFTAFMSSRLSSVWSFVATILIIFAFFITVTVIFDNNTFLMSFAMSGIGMVFSFISIIVYRAMTEEKDKRRIRDMFGKYVSPAVVDQLMVNPPELGGVDKELTVLFSDIRGFTTLSENMSPQELVNHLNIYLTAMTDLILEYGGTLDKYVGDEIMCFWGAPIPQADHAVLASKCALRQMQVLRELNTGWPEHKRINIGIGLNSGIMTVGNMGSPGRMNYTLMGDNVNLGARLEGTNKEYYTNVIISEFTYGLVKDHFIVRELDNIRVKGKNKPVLIYELVDAVNNLDPPKLEIRKKRG